ncbi:MAG: hypothetical protein A2283_05360 [Lentisphaerae bacterium RIFOXYA12_FULL_48_11]|nr:MAG: hypothetical protein A2283_05360 [Lentisphaerae bacterium RIFOXYA12_FULL_48_11]
MNRWIVVVAAVLVAGSVFAGPKWEVGSDSNCWMQLGILAQPHFLYTDDGTDKEDFFLRRGRIILSGQVMDGVMFFVETDSANAGKNGVPTAHVDIQDAYVDFRLNKSDLGEQWLKAGLLLLPFSFENRAGASTLLGVDYNTEVIKLVNSFVWRDYGAELHGNLSDRFSYIVGAYDGYDSAEGTKNPEASLRLTGHIALNLIGKAETSWFFSQERLGKGAPYFSIGAGIDQQDKATLTYTTVTGSTNKVRTITDNEALVVDFQSGCQAGPVGLTLNGGWYTWDNVSFDGDTACVELGAMVKQTQLTGKYSVQDADSNVSVEDYTVGLNYFLKGHNARGGVEYRWGDSPTTVLVGLQFLL